MKREQAMTLWDAVGHTPLLKIASLSKISGCEIFGKAEFLNPSSSIKDRAAKGIIERAEAEGKLKAGSTIVEGTAGNTGIGLAMLGRERGYRVVVTMPNNQASEKYDLLKAFGAEVISLPPVPFANENHFYHQARRYSETHPNVFWANQFENTANSDFHYKTTGPEIWEQMDARIDFVVLAVGSGGTMGGVSRFLKEKDPKIKVILVDPMGSGLYSYVRDKKIEAQGSSITEGIGIMRITENFKVARVDDAVRVNDQQMIETLFYLGSQDGLFLGTSSALNVRAAFELARSSAKKNLRIVTFLCDSGTRYLSKLTNAAWLKEKGLDVAPWIPEVKA